MCGKNNPGIEDKLRYIEIRSENVNVMKKERRVSQWSCF